MSTLSSSSRSPRSVFEFAFLKANILTPLML